jgi:hypothetical protein
MTDSEIADKLAEIRRAEANAIEVADAALGRPRRHNGERTLMTTWNDTANRSWTVRLNCGNLKRLRDTLGVDLLDATKTDTIGALLVDPEQLPTRFGNSANRKPRLRKSTGPPSSNRSTATPCRPVGMRFGNRTCFSAQHPAGRCYARSSTGS